MKLTLNDKLQIIKLYEEGYSISRLSKEFKVSNARIGEIERQYREHGIESFEEKGKYNTYTADFKYNTIQRVFNGESVFGVANSLLIRCSLIQSWIKKYNELGYNGLMNTKKGRPPKMKSKDNYQTNQLDNSTTNNSSLTNDERKEFEQLKERNKQLEMENDLLKKLRALVQQRTQQQNKKK